MLVFRLVTVSTVVMGIAQVLAKEKIFEPFRQRCGSKERFFGYLVSCPYCISHWVSFVVVPLTGSFFFPVPWHWGFFSSVLNWFFSCILVTTLAAFMRVGFYFVDETQGLVRRRQRTVEEEAALHHLTREHLEEQVANGRSPDAH